MQHTRVNTVEHGAGVVTKVARRAGVPFRAWRSSLAGPCRASHHAFRPPATYTVALDAGGTKQLAQWEFEAEKNTVSNKLVLLKRHINSGTIKLTEDGQPSLFVGNFRQQMGESIARLRATRLLVYKVRRSAHAARVVVVVVAVV